MQEQALELAAEETYRRIDEHLASATPEIEPLVRHIREHVFDEGFKVSDLVQTLGASNNLIQVFRAEVGQTVSDYITGARVETAARLLRDTSLSIETISLLVGYPDTPGLRNAFKRWPGLRPTEFRDKLRLVLARTERPEGELLSIRFWNKLTQGELDPARVKGALTWLWSTHGLLKDGDLRNEAASKGRERFREQLLEEIWQWLSDQPYLTQLRLVREEIRFGSPALFYLLGEKSRVEGREDRGRGIELSELALASLEGCADVLGEAYHDHCALGWAWIGRARRLALDRDGAEQAFARAGEVWQTPRTKPDRRIEAEILFLKGTLRIVQRRFREARELLDRAIGICRAGEEKLILAKSLIQRAKIADFLGDHEAAIADLQVARELLEDLDDRYLTLVAHTNLATSYAWAGKPEKALEFLPEARRLCAELDNRLGRHHVQWIEGLARLAQGDEAGAEVRLRQAQAGFNKLGELDHGGVASLEVAILCRRQGRDAEVVSLASEAIPAFKALRTYPEAVTALRLLGDAVAKGEVTLEVLEQARDCLLTIVRDPGSAPLSQS